MELESLQVQIGFGVLVAFALGVLMLALRPQDRTGLRRLLALLLLLAVLLGAALALGHSGLARAARVLSAISAIGVGVVIIRLGSMFAFRSLMPRLRLEMPGIAEDLCVAALALAWLIYWLHGAGLDLGSLLATSAVITAVLAFAMQDTLGNILGGVVLQLDDSVRIGEWVRIDDISGQVVEVRWRHTAVETRDGETVVIPNGWLVKNRFRVIGLRRLEQTRWRRWVWFNIELTAKSSLVLQTLEEAVRDSDLPNVLAEPPPSAVLMEVGQGYARYALRYWMADPRPDDPTDSAVRQHALAALARQNIALAVVREERMVHAEDDKRDARARELELARRQALLAEVDLFSVLAPEELRALAEQLVVAPFPRGSTITRQGRVAHWLYLICSGEAEVWIEQQGKRTHVASLLPGSVVGEMGMMTGAPRRATVTARSDVECLRLGRRAFESVLRARPEIASEISAVIAARQGELDIAQQAADSSGDQVRQPDALGARIRAFFGLE